MSKTSLTRRDALELAQQVELMSSVIKTLRSKRARYEFISKRTGIPVSRLEGISSGDFSGTSRKLLKLILKGAETER